MNQLIITLKINNLFFLFLLLCFTNTKSHVIDCHNIYDFEDEGLELTSCVTTVVIDQSASDLTVQFDPDGIDVEINNWINNNANAQASSSCGPITWSHELTSFESPPFEDFATATNTFIAVDSFGNQSSTTATLTIQNIPTAGFGSGSNGTLCSIESYDLTQIDGFVDTSIPLFGRSSISISQSDGPNGASVNEDKIVDFPDTGAGSFTYIFKLSVSTTQNVGAFEFNMISEADYFVNNVTVPFDPGPDKVVPVCDFSVLSLISLYEELDIVVDIDQSGFSLFTSDDFFPENYWYNETDNLEDGSNPSPLTEITDPGIYQFNAKNFLQDCAGEPVYVEVIEGPLSAGENALLEVENGSTVTVEQLFSALGGSPDPDGVWTPIPAGEGIYTYTHPPNAFCPGSSATVTVDYVLNNETFNLESLKIYPIPTSDKIFIKGNTQLINLIEIFSITDQRLMHLEKSFHEINMQSLKSGVYFLKLETEFSSRTVKLVKN